MTRRTLMTMLAAASQMRAGFEVPFVVDFGEKLRDWDGFGVNYVEVAQTRDFEKDPQEYGGFGTLDEKSRQEIVELIFGEDGLKPGLLKMFLDCWHQEKAGGTFDHKKTTRWMRYFAQAGLKRQRSRGAGLDTITTLYGPPAYMTRQKIVRGRDLDAAHKQSLTDYITHWVAYLRNEEKIPVKYAGLHNEGEDFTRWPTDGSSGGYPRHDYNMYWHSSQVVECMKLLRASLDREGMSDVGVAPGETSNWERFVSWGYAWAISEDPEALRVLGLISSHGFGVGNAINSIGTDLIRLKRPELHAWTTSMTWGKMDTAFLELVRRNIYDANVNAVIPWATVQTDTWVGGDPNPGTAFRVDRKGGFSVEPGYWYFKHLCRAGQPGMAVAPVLTSSQDIQGIAFSSNGTKHPDALTLIHVGDFRRDLTVRVKGSRSSRFAAYSTSASDHYRSIGPMKLRDGMLELTIYPNQAISLISMQG